MLAYNYIILAIFRIFCYFAIILIISMRYFVKLLSCEKFCTCYLSYSRLHNNLKFFINSQSILHKTCPFKAFCLTYILKLQIIFHHLVYKFQLTWSKFEELDAFNFFNLVVSLQNFILLSLMIFLEKSDFSHIFWTHWKMFDSWQVISHVSEL